jgi:S-adenosylmethionine synthetase
MVDTATVMADTVMDTATVMAAISGMAIGGAMAKARAGAGPRQVMSGFATNRTSEYLTASGSAAHHFVVRRSAFALGNEHGSAFVRRKLAGAASVSG